MAFQTFTLSLPSSHPARDDEASFAHRTRHHSPVFREVLWRIQEPLGQHNLHMFDGGEGKMQLRLWRGWDMRRLFNNVT